MPNEVNVRLAPQPNPFAYDDDGVMGMAGKANAFIEVLPDDVPAEEQTGARTTKQSAGNAMPDDVRDFYAALRKKIEFDGRLLGDDSAGACLRAVQDFFAWVEREIRFHLYTLRSYSSS